MINSAYTLGLSMCEMYSSKIQKWGLGPTQRSVHTHTRSVNYYAYSGRVKVKIKSVKAAFNHSLNTTTFS